MSDLAKAIREEIVRQYRDDDRRKCLAGIPFWEEEVQPMLLAEVAQKFAATELTRLTERCGKLEAALNGIRTMFYVGRMKAVMLKPNYRNYDVLDTVNAALATDQQQPTQPK